MRSDFFLVLLIKLMRMHRIMILLSKIRLLFKVIAEIKRGRELCCHKLGNDVLCFRVMLV